MRVEDILQDKIVEYLKRKHIWHFRYTASTTFGIPDILALYKGFFIGIEIKREDGKGKSTWVFSLIYFVGYNLDIIYIFFFSFSVFPKKLITSSSEILKNSLFEF